MRFATIFAATLLAAAPAMAGSSHATGAFREVLTLPNGMEVNPLTQAELERVGACGPWGCNPHERAGWNSNDQHNPAAPETGRYTNSNAVNLRYATRADADGRIRLAIVDPNDQKPSTGFTATLRGRDAAGNWGTLGTFAVTEREASGSEHFVVGRVSRAYQRVVVWFKQTSTKVRHGDIVAFGRGSCKAK